MNYNNLHYRFSKQKCLYQKSALYWIFLMFCIYLRRDETLFQRSFYSKILRKWVHTTAVSNEQDMK